MLDHSTPHRHTPEDTRQLANTSVPDAKYQPAHVVLVESHGSDFPGRASLLVNNLYHVRTMKGVSELILLRDEEPVELAVISVLLGDLALVAAARIFRKQWPRARILVLGQAAPVLEDHLYDEAISHTCEQQILFDSLARLTYYPWTEKPGGQPFVVPDHHEQDSMKQAHPVPPTD